MCDALIGFYGADRGKFVGPTSRGNKTREMISRIIAQPVADSIGKYATCLEIAKNILCFCNRKDAPKADDVNRFMQLTRPTRYERLFQHVCREVHAFT